MFVGFVGFSIGSSGLSGGIVDAITGNGTTGGGDTAAVDRLTTQVRAADAKAKAAPTDPAAWAALAQARVRLANVGNNLDTNTGTYTAEGRRQVTAAGVAWDKYVALKPATPDERLARQMAQAFVSTGAADKAVGAQEVLTEIDPTQQTYQNLALLAFQAGQTRKGELASTKAISLAPKDQRKDLKASLDQAKAQAAVQQIQQTAPTPTPTVG
jgi:hypothetical protein